MLRIVEETAIQLGISIALVISTINLINKNLEIKIRS